MRWYKFVIYISIFLFSVYAVSMLFIEESKSFTVEKEINYPIDNYTNFVSLFITLTL